MILVDTSVWVDHLRSRDEALAEMLDRGMVLIHPFVLGEITLGVLRQRTTIVEALSNLPSVTIATDAEVLHFIDRHALFGRGVGYVDVHLLAGARLTDGARVWTRDRLLHGVSSELGLAFEPS
jgi:predicted nucleic acid-binding protein